MALTGPAADKHGRGQDPKWTQLTSAMYTYVPTTHHLPLQPRMNCDTRCLLLLRVFIHSYSGPRGEISYRLPSFDTHWGIPWHQAGNSMIPTWHNCNNWKLYRTDVRTSVQLYYCWPIIPELRPESSSGPVISYWAVRCSLVASSSSNYNCNWRTAGGMWCRQREEIFNTYLLDTKSLRNFGTLWSSFINWLLQNFLIDDTVQVHHYHHPSNSSYPVH